jgi:hypothetical protein
MKVIIDDSECGHYPKRDVVVVIETKTCKKVITVTTEAVVVDIERKTGSGSCTIRYNEIGK